MLSDSSIKQQSFVVYGERSCFIFDIKLDTENLYRNYSTYYCTFFLLLVIDELNVNLRSHATSYNYK